ncbi:unnamed protein product [Arabidopsis lyrata]|nr:unnamed protein product [Arabidopsis lyrata]
MITRSTAVWAVFKAGSGLSHCSYLKSRSVGEIVWRFGE